MSSGERHGLGQTSTHQLSITFDPKYGVWHLAPTASVCDEINWVTTRAKGERDATTAEQQCCTSSGSSLQNADLNKNVAALGGTIFSTPQAESAERGASVAGIVAGSTNNISAADLLTKDIVRSIPAGNINRDETSRETVSGDRTPKEVRPTVSTADGEREIPKHGADVANNEKGTMDGRPHERTIKLMVANECNKNLTPNQNLPENGKPVAVPEAKNPQQHQEVEVVEKASDTATPAPPVDKTRLQTGDDQGSLSSPPPRQPAPKELGGTSTTVSRKPDHTAADKGRCSCPADEGRTKLVAGSSVVAAVVTTTPAAATTAAATTETIIQCVEIGTEITEPPPAGCANRKKPTSEGENHRKRDCCVVRTSTVKCGISQQATGSCTASAQATWRGQAVYISPRSAIVTLQETETFFRKRKTTGNQGLPVESENYDILSRHGYGGWRWVESRDDRKSKNDNDAEASLQVTTMNEDGSEKMLTTRKTRSGARERQEERRDASKGGIFSPSSEEGSSSSLATTPQPKRTAPSSTQGVPSRYDTDDNLTGGREHYESREKGNPDNNFNTCTRRSTTRNKEKHPTNGIEKRAEDSCSATSTYAAANSSGGKKGPNEHPHYGAISPSYHHDSDDVKGNDEDRRLQRRCQCKQQPPFSDDPVQDRFPRRRNNKDKETGEGEALPVHDDSSSSNSSGGGERGGRRQHTIRPAFFFTESYLGAPVAACPRTWPEGETVLVDAKASRSPRNLRRRLNHRDQRRAGSARRNHDTLKRRAIARGMTCPPRKGRNGKRDSSSSDGENASSSCSSWGSGQYTSDNGSSQAEEKQERRGAANDAKRETRATRPEEK